MRSILGLIIFSLLRTSNGFAFMEGKISEEIVNNRNISNIIDNRQQWISCGGPTISLAGTSWSFPIVVDSPNFPQNYPLNRWCLYNMDVPANRQLVIEILYMDMECPWDYAAFATSVDPNILTLCPQNTVVQPSYYLPPRSQGYTFRVVFNSDNMNTRTGFRILAYLDTTVPPPTTTTLGTTTTRVTATTTRVTATTTITQRTTTTTRITVSTSTATTTTTPPVCRCGNWGIREAQRIVGGSIAAPHAFPYQVGIFFQSGTLFCGGTLISPNYVLTAAHCVTQRTPSSIRVTVNDVNYRIRGDGEIFFNVSSILIHPSYNVTSFQDNDVALLRLVGSAPISNTINFPCLPPDVTQTFERANMTISGWGYTVDKGGVLSPDLKFAYISGWNNTACAATGYGRLITDNMICASTPKIDTDACQGDSGGPMATMVNGRVTLVGVVSFGSACGRPPFPGVYARVTRLKSWILQNSDAGNCQN